MNALNLPWLAMLAFSGPEPTKAEPARVQVVGDVVPLAEVLAKRKLKQDDDAASTLVLLTTDGTVYPLIKNDESRLFFLDKRLQNRPMRVTGQVVAGNFLKVESVRSIKDGVLHDVYYWCEKCQLRFPHAGICSCCGAVTELWEEPETTAPKKTKK